MNVSFVPRAHTATCTVNYFSLIASVLAVELASIDLRVSTCAYQLRRDRTAIDNVKKFPGKDLLPCRILFSGSHSSYYICTLNIKPLAPNQNAICNLTCTGENITILQDFYFQTD